VVREDYPILKHIYALREEVSGPFHESLYFILKNSYKENCMTYFFNNSGELIGYIAWACVVKESVSRLFMNDELPVYCHEWHEGRIFLILDVCCKDKFPITVRRLLSFVKSRKLLAYKRSSHSKTKVWVIRNKVPRAIFLD